MYLLFTIFVVISSLSIPYTNSAHCVLYSSVNNVFILYFIRKGGMRQESSESQAFTFCPGSCPRQAHLLWDPCVCVSPSQPAQAWWRRPMGLQGGSANGRTRTVGRPDHQCWNGDQQWNLGKKRFCLPNVYAPQWWKEKQLEFTFC